MIFHTKTKQLNTKQYFKDPTDQKRWCRHLSVAEIVPLEECYTKYRARSRCEGQAAARTCPGR